jgi:hypothetical protein
MNHHSGLQCEQPFRIKGGKRLFRQVFFNSICVVPDKNAEAVLIIRIPPIRNQPAGLVQANGKRQMIAVLQNGCAVGCSLAIAINRLFSFYIESSAR